MAMDYQKKNRKNVSCGIRTHGFPHWSICFKPLGQASLSVLASENIPGLRIYMLNAEMSAVPCYIGFFIENKVHVAGRE
jgi:hypothetical protein